MTPKSGETLVEGVEGPSRCDCSYIFAGSSREEPMSSENFQLVLHTNRDARRKLRTEKPHSSFVNRASRTTKSTPNTGETLVEGPFRWDYSHFCAGYAREEPMNSENLNFTPTEMRAENG